MDTCIWNAEEYAKHSQGQQKWARELIDKLSLKGREDILDIGCGDGKVTVELASSVKEGAVVGIDSSSSMIDLARKRYPTCRYANLSFELKDAKELVYRQRFDVVFSNAALHWVKDHRPVVEGVYRSLRPGGKILFQMGGQGNAEEILAVLDEMISFPKWEQYFTGFEFPYEFPATEDYDALLRGAGFSIKRIELIPKDMEHDGKSGLMGWIRTTWLPYTHRVPEDLREEFIEELSSRYLEKVPVARDGKVHVAMVRIEIEAEKSA